MSTFGINALCVCVFCLGCLHPSTAAALRASDYLPLASGNEWRYGNSGGGPSSSTLRARFIRTDSAGRQLFALDDLGTGESEIISSNVSRGVELHQESFSDGIGVFNTPVCLAPATFVVGSSCSRSGTARLTIFGVATVTLDFSSTSTITSLATIGTTLGPFNTVRVSTRIRFTGSVQGTAIDETITQTLWVAKDVGAIRATSSDDGTVSLLSAYSIDLDGDTLFSGAPTSHDNCPKVANPNQANNDGDALGDACDPDDDNDGRNDGSDNCPTIANSDQLNSDQDGFGDACDNDDDNDGLFDESDNCPVIANSNQTNFDGDSNGDACDGDDDGDGMVDFFELRYGLNPLDPTDSGLDPDGDGLVNLDEFRRSTNPFLGDSDADGISDDEEIARGTPPNFNPRNITIVTTPLLTE